MMKDCEQYKKSQKREVELCDEITTLKSHNAELQGELDGLKWTQEHCQRLRNAICDCIPHNDPCGDKALEDFPAKLKKERDAAMDKVKQLQRQLDRAIEQDYCTMCGKILDGYDPKAHETPRYGGWETRICSQHHVMGCVACSPVNPTTDTEEGRT